MKIPRQDQLCKDCLRGMPVGGGGGSGRLGESSGWDASLLPVKEGGEEGGGERNTLEHCAAWGRLGRPQGSWRQWWLSKEPPQPCLSAMGLIQYPCWGQSLAGKFGDRLQSTAAGPSVSHVPFSWKSAHVKPLEGGRAHGELCVSGCYCHD